MVKTMFAECLVGSTDFWVECRHFTGLHIGYFGHGILLVYNDFERVYMVSLKQLNMNARVFLGPFERMLLKQSDKKES